MTAISKDTHTIRMAARRARQQLRNARGSHFEAVYYSLNSASLLKSRLQMFRKEPYLKVVVSGMFVRLLHPTKGWREVTEYERQER